MVIGSIWSRAWYICQYRALPPTSNWSKGLLKLKLSEKQLTLLKFQTLLTCIRIFLILTQGHFFIAFQRQRKGETETSIREKHQLIASHAHPEQGSHMPGLGIIRALDQGLNPQLRYVSWPGIEPAIFWLQDNALTSWDTLVRAKIYYELDLWTYQTVVSF